MSWANGHVRTRVIRLVDHALAGDVGGRVELARRLGCDDADVSLPTGPTAGAVTLALVDLTISRGHDDLANLATILINDFHSDRTLVETTIARLTLWLAATADGLSLDLTSLDPLDAHALFDLSTTLNAPANSNVARWRGGRAPGTTPTTRLPPVLHLKLLPTDDGHELTEAWFRALGSPPRDLTPPPDARTGLPPDRPHFANAAQLRAHAVQLAQRALHMGLVPDVEHLVLLVETDVDATHCALRAQKHRFCDLDAWFKAVALWPVHTDDGGRTPATGAAHDGPFPAPKPDTDVEAWTQRPANPGRRCAGVWAEGWTTEAPCYVIGSHDKRAFTVLCAPGDAEPLTQQAHPAGAPLTLDALFAAVRGRATLLWTDHRLLRRAS